MNVIIKFNIRIIRKFYQSFSENFKCSVMAIVSIHRKFNSNHHSCQHIRRKIQRPDVNVQNDIRCGGPAMKRIASRRPSNDRTIETAIDKLEEIGSDGEVVPPLPPRPPMSRQRFTLSMETGKRPPESSATLNNLRIESVVSLYHLRTL